MALIERNGVKYINEPHPGGGNPVLAIGGKDSEAIFTDMLGTSLGKIEENRYSAIAKTSFGADTSDKSSFFTGKPYVEELGYAFLFRNYRPDMGKWQISDIVGYPDGWNNFSYCCNSTNINIDFLGAWATGTEYSIQDPNTPWGIVLDTRTPSRDKSLAENAPTYFWWNNAPLSEELVRYVMSSTAASNPNGYNLGDRYSTEIKKDVGFNAVNSYVNNRMESASDGTITFNDKVSTTLSSNYDLAHSIHGVTFTLIGQITKTNGAWSGALTISYSDPYDFNMNDPDWAVRVFGRLYAYGWITKFNVNGSFTASFSGGNNEPE